MREQAIGRCPMPVHRIRRDIDHIARVQHLRLLAFEADAADAGQTEERLPNRVLAAGSGELERYPVRLQSQRSLRA